MVPESLDSIECTRAHSPQFISCTGITGTEGRIALFALFCSVVARFYSLLLGYSVDDYQFFQSGLSLPAQMSMRDGRPLAAVLCWLFDKLGSEPPFAAVLGWTVLTLALIAIGLFFCRLWRIDKRPLISTAAVLVFVLHPYQTEIFTFHEVTFLTGLAVLAVLYALLYSESFSGKWFLSVILVAASLSIYQLVLNYFVLGLLLGILFHIDELPVVRRLFFVRLGRRAAALVAGVALYEIALRVVAALMHIPPIARTGLLPFRDIGERLTLASELVKRMFWSTEAVMPAATKYLLLLMLAVFLLAFLLERSDKSSALRTIALFVLLLIVAIPACIGLELIVQEWWPAARMFTQVGLFWAALISFVLSRSGLLTRKILTVPVILILLSFVGTDDHLTADQLRSNRRDAAEANRIVMRLEMLPNFNQLQGVAIEGGRWWYPSPLSGNYDMNVSAFGKPWSKLPLLNEVSGYNFQPVPPAIDTAAIAYCTSVALWPSSKSVSVIQSYGVVCLPK